MLHIPLPLLLPVQSFTELFGAVDVQLVHDYSAVAAAGGEQLHHLGAAGLERDDVEQSPAAVAAFGGFDDIVRRPVDGESAVVGRGPGVRASGTEVVNPEAAV